MKKPRYEVTTWDMDLQAFTPQRGVQCGPYSKWGLRCALRKLFRMGYEVRRRGAPSVLVQRSNP